MKLNIGIVGGSIAGCSAAILLTGAGHDTEVFERSPGELVGRGGGIGTPVPTLQKLMDEGLLATDFPHLVGRSMPFVVRTDAHPRLGHRPWEMPMNLAAFGWSDLWRALRAQVPDDRYHAGTRVAGAHEGAEQVHLELADGSTRVFDLVVFADGYRSLGRELLFPDAGLSYRGYMLWRGLLPERELGGEDALGAEVPRVNFSEGHGNLVLYYVPGMDGSTAPGERLVNWASYVPLDPSEVDAFMVDRSGRRRVGTMPPGHMRPEVEAALKAQARAVLPSWYGDILEKTRDTYAQLIYTARPKGYHRGRMLLIGDAGVVAQPFTGSGVFKGYNNIESLVAALAAHPRLEDALESWGVEQTQLGARLLALGQQMERAFIWEPLELASADEATTAAWWRASVTFPEDFTYEDT